MAMGAMMEGKAKRSCCRRGEEKGDQETAMEDLHVPLLPHHLVVRILGMLPIPCIAKARLVCRSWNSLLSSPAFLSSVQATEWWLVMASPSWAAPDFVAFRGPARPDSRGGGAWASFRLPAALPDLPARIAFSQSIVPSVVNMLAASSAGLICAVIKGGMPAGGGGGGPATSPSPPTSPHLIGKLEYDVAVFNVLTGALALLPRPSRLSNKLVSSCSIAMSASTSSSPATYSVILSDPKLRDLEIYDSRAATWRKGLGINAASYLSADRPATFGDLLGGAVLRYHREELASYSLASDSWWKVPVALPRGSPAELLSCTVIKSSGRILLVACLMEHSISMKGFGIWQLQPFCLGGAHHQDLGLFTWVQVAQTPPHILDAFGTTQFLSPSFYDPRFAGHGDFLCMSGAHYTIGTSSQPQYWPPLLYDLVHDQWHLLPPHKHSQDLLCAFPFVPSFSILV